MRLRAVLVLLACGACTSLADLSGGGGPDGGADGASPPPPPADGGASTDASDGATGSGVTNV